MSYRDDRLEPEEVTDRRDVRLHRVLEETITDYAFCILAQTAGVDHQPYADNIYERLETHSRRDLARLVVLMLSERYHKLVAARAEEIGRVP